MMAIGFDTTLERVRITGEAELFSPRSLIASRDGDQISAIRATNGEAIVCAPYGMIASLGGAPFASAEACLAYLQAAFARRPVGAAIEAAIAVPDLGGHRVVRVAGPGLVELATSDLVTQAGTVVGLTLGAAEAGAWVDVLTRGPVREAAFDLGPGPVFLGGDGLLTQTAPTHGFVQQVGTALAPDRLLVALGEPYILAS